MSLRIIPVIFARFDSRRLPGKVLNPLLNGKSIIEELQGQLSVIAKQISCVADPIIATTIRAEDEPVVRAASRMEFAFMTGDLLPLMRLHEVALANPQDWLWRLNADSPLLLWPLIEHVAEELSVIDDEVQVITNLVDRSFPYGVSLEIFRASMISQINLGQATTEECEHLTPIIQRLSSPELRSVVAGDLGLSPFDSTVRLTVDDAEDAAFFRLLWSDSGFRRTLPGSIERMEYAYRRRLTNAT